MTQDDRTRVFSFPIRRQKEAVVEEPTTITHVEYRTALLCNGCNKLLEHCPGHATVEGDYLDLSRPALPKPESRTKGRKHDH